MKCFSFHVLVLVLGLLYSCIAFSNTTPDSKGKPMPYQGGLEIPPILKDGNIEVQTKNGDTFNFEANKWKVVPRVPPKKKRKPRKPKVKIVEKIVEKKTFTKHRVSLLVGVGPSGLEQNIDDDKLTVESDLNPVLGLSYDYQWKPKWSFKGAGFSNSTVAIGVGYNF